MPVRRGSLVHVTCITLLLGACCPAALPTTADPSAAGIAPTAGVSASLALAASLPTTAFVAIVELDPDGTLWARNGHGIRTRLVLRRVSGEADPTPTYGQGDTGSLDAASVGRPALAVSPGELAYVTGRWSDDGTVEVTSIQAMASVRH